MLKLWPSILHDLIDISTIDRVYPDPEVSRVKTVPQDLLVLQDCL